MFAGMKGKLYPDQVLRFITIHRHSPYTYTSDAVNESCVMRSAAHAVSSLTLTFALYIHAVGSVCGAGRPWRPLGSQMWLCLTVEFIPARPYGPTFTEVGLVFHFFRYDEDCHFVSTASPY